MNYEDMPMGFMMALSKKPDAMKKFTELSETEKQDVINAVHSVNSKEEMQRFVDDITRSI